MSTPDRLRIASALLAPPAPGGEGLRVPLEPISAMAAIRAMPNADRAHLSTHIDWAQDYEANETPERRPADPVLEKP